MSLVSFSRRGVLAAGTALALMLGAASVAQAQTPPGVLIAYANRSEVDSDGRIFPTHVQQ